MPKVLHKIKKPRSLIVEASRCFLWDVSSVVTLTQAFGLRYGALSFGFFVIYEISTRFIAKVITTGEKAEKEIRKEL